MFGISNVRFSRDGNRLVAIGDTRRTSQRTIEFRRGLFEFDIHSPGGDWRAISADALPLHSDGKFLLDGRFGSSPSIGFTERMSSTSSVRVR